MNLCRICLSTSADRTIYELKISKKDSKSYSEILLFCLDIKVTENIKITTKLCSKCFRKIVSYYKFKTLALQNDTALKSVDVNCTVKLENEEHSNNNYDPIQYDYDPMKDNYDPIKNNCDPIQNNYDPIKNNYDQIQNNYDPIKNNHDPIKNNYDPIQNSHDPIQAELNEDDFLNNEVKKEPMVIKVEDDTNTYQSDDEMLSVLKNIKQEDPNLIERIPLNEDNNKVKIIRKRGRPKKIKTEEKVSTKQICEECGEFVSDIKQHSIKHKPPTERKQIPCKVCEKVFTTYGARNKHYKRKHLCLKYRCEICNKEVSSLKVHMLRIHNPEQMKVACMVCDRRFVSQSVLNMHMLSHTKDKPYECDICQKTFRMKVVMLNHKRQIHDKEKSHLCQYCSKRFFKKCHLQIHLRTHTKERPYKCEDCGRSFSSHSTCKNHRETHRLDKNYHCEHCDMKFVRRDYLRVHMVCHTKEKRYPCKYCGVRFGRSDHRKRHQFTAHEKHLVAT